MLFNVTKKLICKTVAVHGLKVDILPHYCALVLDRFLCIVNVNFLWQYITNCMSPLRMIHLCNILQIYRKKNLNMLTFFG